MFRSKLLILAACILFAALFAGCSTDEGKVPDVDQVDPGRLTITEFEGGLLTHNVYVFDTHADLSSPEAVGKVVTDDFSYIASGALVEGKRNVFLMTGWDGMVPTGIWTASGKYQVIMLHVNGDYSNNNPENPVFRQATISFNKGGATVDFENFAPVVNTFTVTFNTNDGSFIPSQNVRAGSAVPPPTDPVRERHSFTGWFRDANLTQEYNFSTPVTRDITLYVKWEATAFLVIFNSNSGNSIPNQTIDKGLTANRPPDPARETWFFRGWFSDIHLTLAYNFLTPVTSNITLYAKWELRVTNNADSGSGSLRFAIDTA